jgi:hypothetical protein
VYGRDEQFCTAMIDFLRCLYLQPLKWEPVVAANGRANPFPSDVVIHGFRLARAVVVLLTPDHIAWSCLDRGRGSKEYSSWRRSTSPCS